MNRRGVQPYHLLDFQRVFVGEPLLSEIAKQAARTRAARRRQLPLPLGAKARARAASPTELRELLELLPEHADHLQHRRAKRAIRTALQRGWVAWQGSTLHATADGRSALALLGPGVVCGGGSVTALRAVLYARVSTDTGQQDTETQLLKLRELCAQRGWRIVSEQSDRVTGDPARRGGDPPGLRAALDVIQRKKADVLVIFAADRLVRSPAGLLQLIERVQACGGKITSLAEGRDLDTKTPEGELNAFLLGWFARMAMRLTRERTIAGLERAKAQGTKLGRPRRELTAEERDQVLERLGLEQPHRQIARELGIPRRQIERVVAWLKNGGSEGTPTSERPEGA